MLRGAGYTLQRQTELLLLYRFTVVPLLGPKPTPPTPQFRSAVAHGIGDGTPIGYRWSWGTGAQSQPQVSLILEPIGPLTGTLADPFNESAAKAAMLNLAKVYPESVQLSTLWIFAAYLRPIMMKQSPNESAAGVMVLDLHCRTDAGVAASLSTHASTELPGFFSDVFLQALNSAYGLDGNLKSLAALQDFIMRHPSGRKLAITGTTGVDCLSIEDAHVKCHAISQDASFDYIETVLTLGGSKVVSSKALAQLRELLSVMIDSDGPAAPRSSVNAHTVSSRGVSFIFEVNPADAMPKIRLEVDITKQANSPFHIVQAVSTFLAQRGQGIEAQAYMNVLHGILGEPYGPVNGSREYEINAWRGLQASFTFLIDGGE